MPIYTQSLEACLAGRIGKDGISEEAYRSAHADAVLAANRLRDEYNNGTVAFLRSPAKAFSQLTETRRLIDAWRQTAKRLCVIGTGGSSLGGRALCNLPFEEDNTPRMKIRFCENSDPTNPLFGPSGLAGADDTHFLVISKSGATPETVAQFLYFWDCAKAKDENAAERFCVVSQPGDNPLRRIAQRLGIMTLDHDPDLGGRYSVFSSVGLLPACARGIDIDDLLYGAQATVDDFLNSDAAAPISGTALQVGLMHERNMRVSVMMPYADSLELFAHWYCQLWAESLGKEGLGSTAYPALGSVDQHSQLQLWLDGPRDKLITMISPNYRGEGAAFDTATEPELEYLNGARLADLINAQYRATAETLANRGCPVRRIDFPSHQAGPRELGALMMHFMIETVLAGYMMGIDPFDQPAVEEGKALARKYLSES